MSLLFLTNSLVLNIFLLHGYNYWYYIFFFCQYLFILALTLFAAIKPLFLAPCKQEPPHASPAKNILPLNGSDKFSL